MELDRILIEQSIAKQYGILPTAQEELSWSDWSKLVGGLMDDTPLGRVVAIRSETDREVIKKMPEWAKSIRSEWATHRARKAAASEDPAKLRSQMDALERMLEKMFGGGVNNG